MTDTPAGDRRMVVVKADPHMSGRPAEIRMTAAEAKRRGLPVIRTGAARPATDVPGFAADPDAGDAPPPAAKKRTAKNKATTPPPAE